MITTDENKSASSYNPEGEAVVICSDTGTLSPNTSMSLAIEDAHNGLRSVEAKNEARTAPEGDNDDMLLSVSLTDRGSNILDIDAINSASSSETEEESAPLIDDSLINDAILQGTWSVYVSFLTLGLGTLLPWNFFIVAESYWQYKFRNTTDMSMLFSANLTNGSTPSTNDLIMDKTTLQSLYTPLLVCFSQISNCSFLIINALYSKRWPVEKRLLYTLCAMVVLFALTTVFTKINTDTWQLAFFTITMITVVLINCSCALFQGGLFGLAGMFPPRYTTAVVTGQALGGVFASLARIVSLAAGADDTTSACIFFAIAVGVMGVTLIALIYLFKTETYKLHTRRNTEADKREATAEENVPLATQSFLADSKRVLKQIWPLVLSVFMVFFVTLAVFPAVCVHIVSNTDEPLWKDVYFQPVMTFLLFNVADYLGRQLGGLLMWPRKGSRLLYVFVLLRLVFIPLMLLCNHSASRSSIPSVFLSDYSYFFIMLTFGITNGYLGTLCMIYGPSSVENPADAESAGSIMAASLGAGLLGGGLASFGFGSLFF